MKLKLRCTKSFVGSKSRISINPTPSCSSSPLSFRKKLTTGTSIFRPKLNKFSILSMYSSYISSIKPKGCGYHKKESKWFPTAFCTFMTRVQRVVPSIWNIDSARLRVIKVRNISVHRWHWKHGSISDQFWYPIVGASVWLHRGAI